jgi:hypothetical protein
MDQTGVAEFLLPHRFGSQTNAKRLQIAGFKQRKVKKYFMKLMKTIKKKYNIFLTV